MIMTDGEIITSYRQAKNKKTQIGVLADLNGVDTVVMREKLRELGFNVGPQLLQEKDARSARANIVNDAAAQALFDAGKTDEEMAAELGISKYAIQAWRSEKGLRRKYVARKTVAKGPAGGSKRNGAKFVETLSLERFAVLMGNLCDGHPSAAVLLNGKAVTGIQVVSELDLQHGTLRAVQVNLKTEDIYA